MVRCLVMLCLGVVLVVGSLCVFVLRCCVSCWYCWCGVCDCGAFCVGMVCVVWHVWCVVCLLLYYGVFRLVCV